MNGVSSVNIHRGIAPHRIGAMILRYWYLLVSSWPRLLELVYWPALQIVTWGFLQSYIAQNAGFFARAGGTFIGAIILWDILFRGQLGFSISFLEEMWARNLGNLMMSPLKPIEFLISLMIMSLIRLAIGVIPMTLLAIFFFDFNFYSLGLPLIAFFCNLHQLVARHLRVRAGAAQRAGRREHRLDADVRDLAAGLRLLSGDGAAALAAIRRLGLAADLCVRGHAGTADRSRVQARLDDRCAADQRGAVYSVIRDISWAFEQRPPCRLAAPGRRIAAFGPQSRAHAPITIRISCSAH
jgi:hypothetical protein